MPLERENNIFTYVNFFKGRFALKVAPDFHDENVIIRVNKVGDTVRELHFDKLSKVILVDIREVDHEDYGLQWEFIFLDENRYILMRLSKRNRIANMILNKLENLVLTEPMTIRSFYFPEEDKSAISIQQNGKKIENVYTKENPGKLPPPTQTTINNQLTWDWSNQLNYWDNLVKSLKPFMLGVHEEAAQVAQEQATEKPAARIEEERKISNNEPAVVIEEERKALKAEKEMPLTPDNEEDDDLPF